MWTKRHLAVWILLASAFPATPEKAPPPKEPTSGFGSLTTEKISQGFNSILGSIGLQGTIGAITDRINSGVVVGFYKNAIDTLKTMKWNPCVQRLCKGSEMKMWNMRVTFVQKDIQMKVEDLVTDGGFVFAPVKFTFPSPIKLSAKFKYEGTIMMVPYTRFGEAEFELGQVTITVKARLPKVKTVIEQGLMDCQYRLPPNGVISEANKKVKILKVDYKSSTGNDHSKSYMIKSFKKMKKDIIANVVANLESHVVEVTKNVAFSCLEEGQNKWKTPGTSADCATETCD